MVVKTDNLLTYEAGKQLYEQLKRIDSGITRVYRTYKDFYNAIFLRGANGYRFGVTSHRELTIEQFNSRTSRWEVHPQIIPVDYSTMVEVDLSTYVKAIDEMEKKRKGQKNAGEQLDLDGIALNGTLH